MFILSQVSAKCDEVHFIIHLNFAFFVTFSR